MTMVYLLSILVVKSISFVWALYIDWKESHNTEIEADHKVDSSGFYKDLTFSELRNLNRRVREERKNAEQFLKVFERDIEKNQYLNKHLEKALSTNQRELYRRWMRTRQNSIKAIIAYHFKDLINFLKRVGQLLVKERLSKKDSGPDGNKAEEESKIKEKKLRRMIDEMQKLLSPNDEEELEGGERLNNSQAHQRRDNNMQKKVGTEEMIRKFLEVVNKLRLMHINYKNPKCSLLRDVVQSFNLYDAQSYKSAKEVKDFLEQEFKRNGKPLKRKTAQRFIRYT